MSDPDPQLRGGDGRGHGGVHVADYNNEIRSPLQKKLFVGHHDPARLFGVGAVSHAEIEIRCGQAEVHKKGIGHVEIVVLARVDDHGTRPGLFSKGMVERGDLHEVGPRRTDEMNQHVLAFTVLFAGSTIRCRNTFSLRTLVLCPAVEHSAFPNQCHA